MLERDFGESPMIGQMVTDGEAPGATISQTWGTYPQISVRCVIRQLLFPVSMMSQWWVTRSRGGHLLVAEDLGSFTEGEVGR